RKTVRRNPARNVHADGRDLAALRMHAGQSRDAKRGDAKIIHRAHQDFLQVANIAIDVFAIGTQIDYWITHELAQSVVSRLTAAIRFKDSNPARSQEFVRRQNSIRRRAPSQSQRVRMLEQKQRVGLLIRQNRALGLLLNLERSAVL